MTVAALLDVSGSFEIDTVAVFESVIGFAGAVTTTSIVEVAPEAKLARVHVTVPAL